MNEKMSEERSLQYRRRLYIYQTLQRILSKYPVMLVVAIRQAYDPNYNKYLKKLGLCHGLGEVWTRDFLQLKAHYEKMNHDKSAIERACTRHPIDLNFFPINAEVARLQQRQKFQRPKSKRLYRLNAKTCPNLNVLIDTILQSLNLTQRPIMWDEKVFSISRTHYERPFFAALAKKFPNFHMSWHEIRFRIDDQECLHFFDANIGWLQTNQPVNDTSILAACLHDIFKLLHYDEYLVIKEVATVASNVLLRKSTVPKVNAI